MSEELERVGPVDPKLRTSPIVEDEGEADAPPGAAGPPPPDASPEAAPEGDERKDESPAPSVCWYNGKQYSPGAEICAAGWRLRCMPNGTWRKFGGRC